ncbi:MAG: YqiJ family protein [Zoogloeaceae bacterium]|jgi:hypothetical protein|nr:YqiJ family protein [Zoogloeaceae bacterium]
MNAFFATLLAYPTVLYTVLLGAVLVYWVLALIGLVDFDSTGPDLDIDTDVEIDTDVSAHDLPDGEVDGISTLAGWLIALGLGGVPFSIVVSLLTLFGWVFCCLLSLWVLPWVPTTLLRLAVGTGVLLTAAALSVPLAACIVRPMRRLFVSHQAISNAALVGQECVVVTGTVDEKFGRAEVPARGAGYRIVVVAETPNTLKRGDRAVIVEYDPVVHHYRIAAKDSF